MATVDIVRYGSGARQDVSTSKMEIQAEPVDKAVWALVHSTIGTKALGREPRVRHTIHYEERSVAGRYSEAHRWMVHQDVSDYSVPEFAFKKKDVVVLEVTLGRNGVSFSSAGESKQLLRQTFEQMLKKEQEIDLPKIIAVLDKLRN
ncbi:MAG: hypothetical protein KGH66_03135 [Candidatus Micrarchaeota archaeon]|nr:hypothetical protein [Candidatus Micrarchaeota archaeon]